MSRLVSLAIVGFCLSGCVALPIPHDRLSTPVIEGTVLDAKTKAPLSGVRISAKNTTGDALNVVTSDASGRYRAFATSHGSWYYFTPLNIEGVCEGVFTAEKEGYKPHSFKEKYFSWGGNDGLCGSRAIQRPIELESLEPNDG